MAKDSNDNTIIQKPNNVSITDISNQNINLDIYKSNSMVYIIQILIKQVFYIKMVYNEKTVANRYLEGNIRSIF